MTFYKGYILLPVLALNWKLFLKYINCFLIFEWGHSFLLSLSLNSVWVCEWGLRKISVKTTFALPLAQFSVSVWVRIEKDLRKNDIHSHSPTHSHSHSSSSNRTVTVKYIYTYSVMWNIPGLYVSDNLAIIIYGLRLD